MSLEVTLSADEKILLSNIANGLLAPVSGFFTENQYREAIEDCRFEDVPWTIPILLHIDENQYQKLQVDANQDVVLQDENGERLAKLCSAEAFQIDRDEYCRSVFGTLSPDHPGVARARTKSIYCVGGEVQDVSLAPFPHQLSSDQCREWLRKTSVPTATAFSTRNVCHIGHEFLQRRVLDSGDVLGIHVICGATKPGSFRSDVVIESYRYLIQKFYPQQKVILNALWIPPIYAGPKEAFLQATMIQNLGFSKFIVGRDHAGCGGFYGRYASQEIFDQLDRLKISIVKAKEPRFCPRCKKVVADGECAHSREETQALNGTDLRHFIDQEDSNAMEALVRPEMGEFLRTHFKKGELFVADT